MTLFSAPSVAEFAAFLEAQYPVAVARIVDPGAAASQPAASRTTITEEDLARLAAAIPTRRRPIPDGGAKNPSAIFILSPPRSGTTLLRIMLAGHPDLFAASELQLLGFSTLRERAAAYSGRFSGWLDGTVRAIMQARQLEADDAKALMRAAEAEDLTTKQFFGRLQAWVHPRTIVDKSPSYAVDPGALRMAELEFDDALFIHLVRDPRAMIESFERHHMAQILYLDEHPFDPRQLAELVWTMSHRNIIEFLADVPEERRFRLRFEDLVQDPSGQMEALSARLGLAFDPAVLRPYDGLDDKMVDGVYAESAPMGDPGFLAHGRIDPSAAATGASAQMLGAPTLEVAAELGYKLIADDPQALRGPRASLSRQSTLRRSVRGRHDG
jgi:sulfotransferase family protein